MAQHGKAPGVGDAGGSMGGVFADRLDAPEYSPFSNPSQERDWRPLGATVNNIVRALKVRLMEGAHNG